MPAEGGQSHASLRTGRQYLEALRRGGRAIYLDGECIADPLAHPALREGAHSLARLYDFAAAPQNRELMCFVAPETGQPVLRGWQIPHCHADLKAKRLAAEAWAELSFGLMGRTPDHVANFFTGFAAKPQLFAAAGSGFAENLLAFYRHARDSHAYIAYAIVPPQIDRSKPAHGQSDPTLYAGVTRENDAGIFLTGGQQLATGALYADWLHISCIHPLQPGDENHAFSVAVPLDAPGLRLYPRRPYAPAGTDMRDYPLSARFDETDCFVVLDNCFVPWERVFIYRNVGLTRDQWWQTPAHLYGNHQAQARYSTKLRFLLGLARRINEATGHAALPPVVTEMGELTAWVAIVENMLYAHETVATLDADGVLWPSRDALYAVMALQSAINPRVIDIVRELSGTAMLTLPSAARDFENPQAAADIARYYRSAATGADERIRLMRLAWELVGTEFAGRHQQYEKFYGGAAHVVKANLYRGYDFTRALALVDRALALAESDPG